MKTGDRVKVRLWTEQGTVLDVGVDAHGKYATVKWDDSSFNGVVEEVDLSQLEKISR